MTAFMWARFAFALLLAAMLLSAYVANRRFQKSEKESDAQKQKQALFYKRIMFVLFLGMTLMLGTVVYDIY